ncbi:MAG: sodium/proton-translocating pyrophosphatase, partial [Bacilli bacterium]|nr:sodium/proton-translocating pyrophosphatase [Bacilli bacterium]
MFLTQFTMVIIVTIVSILGLLFAFYIKHKIEKVQVENAKIKEIQSYIKEGAMAFLKREYKTLAIFVAILFVVVLLAIDWQTAVCFLVGACLSGLAGFIGMTSATSANGRTTQAAAKGGM